MSKSNEQVGVQKIQPIQKFMNKVGDTMYRATKYRLGRVLTIVDASIPDQEQRKAVKDLIKEAFYENSAVDPFYNEVEYFFKAFDRKYTKQVDRWANCDESSPMPVPEGEDLF